MNATPLLWVALGALSAVSVVVLVWLGKRSRESQLVRMSAGLHLSPEHDESVLRGSGLLDAQILGREEVRCRHVVRGQVRGAEAFLFDYEVRIGRHWHPPDPVVFFHLKEKRLPSFELRPRMTSGEPRGLQFDASSRFNEVYALTGSDERAVRGLFRDDVRAYFERAENQSWAVASMGDWLAVLFWPLGERDKSLGPKEVLGFFEDAKELLFVVTAT